MSTLERIKDILTNEFLSEGQLSQTPYDMANSDNTKSFEKETKKTYEEDRLDLEEILNQESSKKKNYIKKVVNTVNKLIDGTANLDDLAKVVKNKKKRVSKEINNI